jgi:hypothetical protein
MAGNVVYVEIQAAISMRLNGVKEAKLFINHPSGICSRCMQNVDMILQEGQVLKVININTGESVTFYGIGRWR